MKENSNETITVHANPDHLKTEQGRRESIGQGGQTDGVISDYEDFSESNI